MIFFDVGKSEIYKHIDVVRDYAKRGNHAVELHSVEFAKQKINYIHQNPVRAGIVNRAENYLYSSASNYAELGGKIEIDFL